MSAYDPNYILPVTKLTLGQLERFIHLGEECGEVIRALGKIERHGLFDRDPSLPASPDNKEHLEIELRDVISAALRLARHSDINLDLKNIEDGLPEWWERKKRFFHFQEL